MRLRALKLRKFLAIPLRAAPDLFKVWLNLRKFQNRTIGAEHDSAVETAFAPGVAGLAVAANPHPGDQRILVAICLHLDQRLHLA